MKFGSLLGALIAAVPFACGSSTGNPGGTTPPPATLNVFAGMLGGTGYSDGTGAAARFLGPRCLAFDATGTLYVGDQNVIRKVVIGTGEVTTLAGDPEGREAVDGVGPAAHFGETTQLSADGVGNLYVADGPELRKIVIATGAVTSRYHSPTTLLGVFAIDAAGNVYLSTDHAVQKLSADTGLVTTLAGGKDIPLNPGFTYVCPDASDGVGTDACLQWPSGGALDGAGNLYFADTGRIRKVTTDTGVVTTVAGSAREPLVRDGIGADARFEDPAGLAFDGTGNLYVADGDAGGVIRRVDVATGAVVTLVGDAHEGALIDGPFAAARFGRPRALVEDGAGDLYVTDVADIPPLGPSLRAAIRKVDIHTNVVTTLPGTRTGAGHVDGPLTEARFSGPSVLASEPSGVLYVGDFENRSIRKVDTASGEVTTLLASAESGAEEALLQYIEGLATDGQGNLYVAVDGFQDPSKILKVETATGAVTTVAAGFPDGLTGLAADGTGFLYVGSLSRILRLELATGAMTTLVDGGTPPDFLFPSAMVLDGAGHLYVAEALNNDIRVVDVATGVVTTLAGDATTAGSLDGAGAAARFYDPAGLALNGAGSLYVADRGNHTVRQIEIATGVVTTLVGQPHRWGVRPGALPGGLNGPSGLAVGADGALFVADRNENALLVVR